MNKQDVDYSLYLVTDRNLSQGRSIIEVVKSAVNGGVTIVQLREKSATTLDFYQSAKQIKSFLDKKGIPLIINDRIDIALAVDADGVHLGQDDMPLPIARKVLGKDKIIGISVNNVEEAKRAEQESADYLGLSPVFPTPTKTDTSEPIGIERIPAIRNAVSIPLVGIGGLNIHNAAEVIKAGCDGIAVVSAIVSAENPEIAAKELLDIILFAKRTS